MSSIVIIVGLLLLVGYKVFDRIWSLKEYKVKHGIDYKNSMEEIDRYIHKIDEDFGDV